MNNVFYGFLVIYLILLNLWPQQLGEAARKVHDEFMIGYNLTEKPND